MHEENWVTFNGEIDDAPAMFSVDVGWVEESPDTSRRWWLCVRRPLSNATDNGLPTPEGLDDARVFEDRLVPLVEKACTALIVGSISTAGTRTWCFYGKTKAGLEQAAAAAGGGPGVETTAEDDPQWEQYEDTLAPDESQVRYINDVAVIHELIENGDSLATPRDIEHLALFPSVVARDRFGDWCKKNGFKVANVYKLSDEDADPDDLDEPLLFAIEFTHRAPADVEAIFPMTQKATAAADDFGGYYDGWQSSVVKNRR